MGPDEVPLLASNSLPSKKTFQDPLERNFTRSGIADRRKAGDRLRGGIDFEQVDAIDTGNPPDNRLNLIVEVNGERFTIAFTGAVNAMDVDFCPATQSE